MSKIKTDTLQRFVSQGQDRITVGDLDCVVLERSDRRDHTRRLCLYAHTSLNDYNLPARNPYFMGVGGTGAVVTSALDYLLATKEYQVVSTEFRGEAVGPTPSNAWGADVGLAKMEAARIWSLLPPGAPDSWGGLGCGNGKLLLIGYSHGGPMCINYLREHSSIVQGALIFAGAIGLRSMRGLDNAHSIGYTAAAGGTTTVVKTTTAAFNAGMVNTFSVTIDQGNYYLITGYTSTTQVTVQQMPAPIGAGTHLIVAPNAYPRSGFYDDINAQYKNDSHNPTPGTVNDASWATIAAVHDATLYDWSAHTPKPPILWMHSQDDLTAPYTDATTFANNYGSQCEFHTLPSGNGGHFSGVFANDPYKTMIHDFIDRLE